MSTISAPRTAATNGFATWRCCARGTTSSDIQPRKKQAHLRLSWYPMMLCLISCPSVTAPIAPKHFVKNVWCFCFILVSRVQMLDGGYTIHSSCFVRMCWTGPPAALLIFDGFAVRGPHTAASGSTNSLHGQPRGQLFSTTKRCDPGRVIP